MNFKTQIEDRQREIICNALEDTMGNVSATASRLEMPKKSLYNLLHRLRIDPNDYRKWEDVMEGRR